MTTSPKGLQEGADHQDRQVIRAFLNRSINSLISLHLDDLDDDMHDTERDSIRDRVQTRLSACILSGESPEEGFDAVSQMTTAIYSVLDPLSLERAVTSGEMIKFTCDNFVYSFSPEAASGIEQTLFFGTVEVSGDDLVLTEIQHAMRLETIPEGFLLRECDTDYPFPTGPRTGRPLPLQGVLHETDKEQVDTWQRLSYTFTRSTETDLSSREIPVFIQPADEDADLVPVVGLSAEGVPFNDSGALSLSNA